MKLNFATTIVDRIVDAVKAASQKVATIELTLTERYEVYKAGDRRVTKLPVGAERRRVEASLGIVGLRGFVQVAPGLRLPFVAAEKQ